MKNFSRKLFFFLASVVACSTSFSALNDYSERWNAKWIAPADAVVGGYNVMHFRKTFELDVVPQKLEVNVSADARYKLYVNGKYVGNGASSGDTACWYYEVFDIAPYLKKGKNIISAKVWNFGKGFSPSAQISVRPAFILDSVEKKYEFLSTNKSWKAIKSNAYLPVRAKRLAIGAGINFDAEKYLWGWENIDFDDSAWKSATTISLGKPICTYGGIIDWLLTKRDIPQMEETPIRFVSIRRFSGVKSVPNFIFGNEPLTIPAKTKCKILLDNAVNTTAYPKLFVDKGKSSKIKLRYAEALQDKDAKKYNRNDIDGLDFAPAGVYGAYTLEDIFVADGKKREFTTLYYRPYRYVQMEIETADEPLIISDFSAVFTAYPFEEIGAFSSDDKSIDKIWEVGWRTIRLCAFETFMDCPYFEQLQYIGDTRIQAIVSLCVSGDDRLMKKALKMFALSRDHTGLLQSRYPSAEKQYIPGFSLFWIGMLHDYMMWRGDVELLTQMTPAMLSILEYFNSQMDKNTGMLRADMPYWSFADWSGGKKRGKERVDWWWGNPPVSKTCGSAVHTLAYASALKQASDILKYVGRADDSKKFLEQSKKIAQEVGKRCWDEKRGLLLDYIGAKSVSQHANLWAILTDAIPVERQREVFDKIMSDKSVAQCSFYYRYYLTEAMRKVGRGDTYIAELQPWRQMVADGLTTFAENPSDSRSDCHAWSSSPNYHLLSLVCGIMPSSPEFKTVRIEPNMASLKFIEGKVAHKKGLIKLKLSRKEKSIKGEIYLPSGLSGEFVWNKKSIKLSEGKNKIAVD